MGQRIVIINRWADDFAAYEKSIDHTQHQVCYIVNRSGRQGIRADRSVIEDILEVEKTNDLEELLRAGREIIDRHGPIDRILALSEFDLKEAAELRTRLGVAGIQEEQVRLYKDKVVMKQRMQERGLRVPKFLDDLSEARLFDFAAEVGFPLILKPKTGAASQGVYRVESEAELRQVLAEIELAEYEGEEFVQGPIFHVDGLVREGELVFIKPSQYINTCLAFNHGVPLGSFLVDDADLRERLNRFTAETLAALELHNSAFHLEIILRDGQEPVFLEIGARVGGGEIPFLMRELYGIDLVDEWIKIELGLPGQVPETDDRIAGGFLMVPEPQDRPCRVIGATSMVGRIPTLVSEILPQPGDLLDGNGGYEEIGGRFLFRGESSEEVQRDILETIRTYRLTTANVMQEQKEQTT